MIELVWGEKRHVISNLRSLVNLLSIISEANKFLGTSMSILDAYIIYNIPIVTIIILDYVSQFRTPNYPSGNLALSNANSALTHKTKKTLSIDEMGIKRI